MNTSKFPDVSNHNYPLSLAGAPVVIAKATQGTGFKDPYYSYFKNQAVSMGAPFMGYHWMDTADLQLQAKNAYSVVGPSVPLMWDAEADGVTVGRLVEITDRYRQLGGLVHMLYLPKWWWSGHMGSANLTPLIQAGLYLISSQYTTYSDTGPGWQPYGGMTPVQWQYTSSQPFNGKNVDFNAYKGTPAQYQALITGGDVALTQQDADLVVKTLMGWMINASSESYNQPYAEYIKWIIANANAIGRLSEDLAELQDQVEAISLVLTPEQLEQVKDAASEGASEGVADSLNGATATIHITEPE